MAATTIRAPREGRAPRPGVLRFCGTSCHDGYVTDVRYGLAVSPRVARATGYRNTTGRCDYCAAIVPPNKVLVR